MLQLTPMNLGIDNSLSSHTNFLQRVPQGMAPQQIDNSLSSHTNFLQRVPQGMAQQQIHALETPTQYYGQLASNVAYSQNNALADLSKTPVVKSVFHQGHLNGESRVPVGQSSIGDSTFTALTSNAKQGQVEVLILDSDGRVIHKRLEPSITHYSMPGSSSQDSLMRSQSIIKANAHTNQKPNPQTHISSSVSSNAAMPQISAAPTNHNSVASHKQSVAAASAPTPYHTSFSAQQQPSVAMTQLSHQTQPIVASQPSISNTHLARSPYAALPGGAFLPNNMNVAGMGQFGLGGYTNGFGMGVPFSELDYIPVQTPSGTMMVNI